MSDDGNVESVPAVENHSLMTGEDFPKARAGNLMPAFCGIFLTNKMAQLEQMAWCTMELFQL